MTAILPTTRLRLFDVPHKALRHLMGQVSLLAGHTDFRFIEQIEVLHAKANVLFRLLHLHARDENNFTLAELEARVPGAAQPNLDDHEEIEYRQAGLEKMLDELRAAACRGADVRALGDAFYRAFHRFQAAYLQHMLEEEEVTQVTFWQHFSDRDIVELRRRILAAIEPRTMHLWVEYALPAFAHAERVSWLRAMRAAAPPAAFAQVILVAARVLPKEAFDKLEAELHELVFA